MEIKMRTIKQNGFTLLEILVSVGVLAIVGILIAQVLITTAQVNTKTTNVANIKQNGEFALNVINRLIRASMMNATPCDLNAASTVSALLIAPNYTTTTLSCVSDGTSARIASISGTGTVQYLTNPGVTLSASGGPTCADSTLSFNCPDPGGSPVPITVQFNLNQTGATQSGYSSSTQFFQASVEMRNE